MRKTRVLAMTTAVVASVAIMTGSIAVFAGQTGSDTSKGLGKLFTKGHMNTDPVERLEKEKENINRRVKDGKLTQAEADKRTVEIDKKIKEIKEFNSMPLEQKKAKLLNDFTSIINERVKNGKLTQEEADKMLSSFKTKLEAWDGTGNVPLSGMGFMDKGGEMARGEGRPGHRPGDSKGAKAGVKDIGNLDQMLQKQKENIQQKVTDGKLTQEEANKLIAKIDEKLKQIQEFNSMTLEQKKEKLLYDFTASIGKRVTDGKLTQEEADQRIAEFKTKLDKWDGTGKPPFNGKGMKGGKGFENRFQKDTTGSKNQQQ